MELYIGGAYQGKLAFLRRRLGEPPALCREGETALPLSAKGICGLHIWVRAVLDAGGEPEAILREHLPQLREKILVCDLLGSGIVPLTPEDRRWREAVGRCLQLLAKNAGVVTEFLAGIPRVLLRRQRLTLLRHGQTAYNQAHRYCGAADPPLSPEGAEQLRALRYPPADRYFSSASRRAQETLSLLFPGQTCRICPELAECRFGEYEGRTYDELKDRPEYQAWILDETGELSPPGGESRNAHLARVKRALNEILAEPFLQGTAVTHGGTIAQLMADLFPGEKNFYEWQPAFGEGWTVCFENGRPVSYQREDGKCCESE